MRKSKTKREQELIHQFRELYPKFPKGKLIKSESPDFILKESVKKQTGIELVSIPNPEPLIESIRETILAKEEKLLLYQKRMLSEYWLIITCNVAASDISFNYQNLLDKTHFPNNYKHIFFFDTGNKKVIELTD